MWRQIEFCDVMNNDKSWEEKVIYITYASKYDLHHVTQIYFSVNIDIQ